MLREIYVNIWYKSIGLSQNWLLKPESKINKIRESVNLISQRPCLSSSQSQFTLNQNHKVFSHLKRIQELKKNESNIIERIKRVDCKELIRDAKKEIRRANYQLSTLISDGATGIQVFKGVPQTIELLDNLPTYVKIMSK